MPALAQRSGMPARTVAATRCRSTRPARPLPRRACCASGRPASCGPGALHALCCTSPSPCTHASCCMKAQAAPLTSYTPSAAWGQALVAPRGCHHTGRKRRLRGKHTSGWRAPGPPPPPQGARSVEEGEAHVLLGKKGGGVARVVGQHSPCWAGGVRRLPRGAERSALMSACNPADQRRARCRPNAAARCRHCRCACRAAAHCWGPGSGPALRCSSPRLCRRQRREDARHASSRTHPRPNRCAPRPPRRAPPSWPPPWQPQGPRRRRQRAPPRRRRPRARSAASCGRPRSAR